MAIASVGSIGTGGSSVSGSNFTFATSANALAAGDFALLTVVTDNISTVDGVTNNHTSVSGGTGTWSKLGEYTNGEGSAGAGVTVSLWLFEASGTVATGTTIGMTLSGNVVDKVCSGWKYTKAPTSSIRIDADAGTNPVTNATDASAGFGSVNFTGLPSQERLYFRALGKEANSSTNLTVSANFTQITAQRSRNNAAAVIVRGEFRINTSTGETSNPTLADVGDTAGLFFALEELAQLTPGLFVNSQTFFSPTVAPGAVDLAPSLFTSSPTFPSATVTIQALLSPDLFTNASTFHAPTAAATYQLSPSLFTNAAVFSSAVVSTSYTLSPDVFNSGQTFYSPIVTPANFLSPPLFANSQSFYGPSVLATYGLAPDLFVSAQVFYSPMVWADTEPGSGSWSGVGPSAASWVPTPSTAGSWS